MGPTLTFHCMLFVQVAGKLLIPRCSCASNKDRYLVEQRMQKKIAAVTCVQMPLVEHSTACMTEQRLTLKVPVTAIDALRHFETG